jgi:hypothetical protein
MGCVPLSKDVNGTSTKNLYKKHLPSGRKEKNRYWAVPFLCTKLFPAAVLRK